MDVKRYDIVQADLSGTVGSEQGGVRPVLIIQNDVGNLHSPTTIIMPFSTQIFKNPNQPTHTLIKKSADTGLRVDSILLGEQMRVISNKRIIKKLEQLQTKMKEKKFVGFIMTILENKYYGGIFNYEIYRNDSRRGNEIL